MVGNLFELITRTIVGVSKGIRKFTIILIILIVLTSCTRNKKNEMSSNFPQSIKSIHEVADSIVYFRENHLTTDFLSRTLPLLTMDEAILIQLETLKREIEGGKIHIGWKMARTTGDSTSFDPLFGYILSKNLMNNNDIISLNNFPGSVTLVEGELGFIFKRDFPEGVKTIDELINGIDYVVGAVEFAQSNAIATSNDPESLTINHVLAFGMGHVGIIIGDVRYRLGDFDFENESVNCYIDDKLVASGSSSNIYGGHVNALYYLVNMLPKYGAYIKKDEIVITGSLYINPTVNSPCEVNLAFNNLGSINFQIK